MNRIKEFLNYKLDRENGSIETNKGYRSDLKIFYQYIKRQKQIQDINDEVLQSLKLKDLDNFIIYVKKERNNSAYGQNRKIATIKSFFKYLYKQEIVNKNVAQDLEKISLPKRNPKALDILQIKNMITIIKNSPRSYEMKIRDECIISLFFNCGMRLSELCSLNISNINKDSIDVIGKGNKQRRIYLNESIQQTLNDYLIVRKQYILKIKKQEDQDALFISRKMNRISNRNVERIVKNIMIQAGISSEYHTHNLRTTCATELLKAGVNLREIQEILGHENLSVTQNYLKVKDDDLKESMNRIPSIL
jgi:site-specific recombinase XerD